MKYLNSALPVIDRNPLGTCDNNVVCLPVASPMCRLINRLTASISLSDDTVSVMLGGDFNSLNVAEVSARTGLIPLTSAPTRGANTLDVFMITPPQRHNIKVVSSTVRSDHKAILVTADTLRDRTKTSTRKKYRQLRASKRR